MRRALGINDAFVAHGRLVGHFDLVALATERQQITHYNPTHHAPWPILDTGEHVIKPSAWVRLNDLHLVRRRWSDWRDLFLLRYFDLCRAVNATEPTALALQERAA